MTTSTDLFQQMKELPLRRYVDMLRNVTNDYVMRLDTAAAWDQYPGKKIPYCYSKLYGPISLQATRHVSGAVGFLKLAPLVSTSVPVLPRNTNILVGQDIAFYWSSVNVYGYYSWTYTTDPGLPVVVPPVAQVIDPRPAGDIYDSVIANNGGAVMLQNFSNTLNPATGVQAHGSIQPVAGAGLVDGETFTLNDGANPAVVFEFDSNGIVVPGNVPVPFTALDTAATVQASIIAAVNGAPGPLNITASAGAGTLVVLVNDFFGPVGNVPILEAVANPAFVVAGMAGGVALGFVRSVPHISFDLDLYDKKRGRSLTGERMPAQLLLGHTYDMKNSFGGREMRFDPNTEIEPRLYVNEIRMTDALDFSDAAFNAASVACYVNVLFKGTAVLQEGAR